MANLVVDIGNTALKAAWADSVTLGKTFRYQGEMIMDFISSLTRKNRPETLVISSVSDISDRDRSRLEKECEKLVIIDRKRIGILHDFGLPSYLTPDRAASIIASRYLFKGKGCTVVDFGTTMTIDFMDCDGNYLGGNISPGCRTRFKALNRYSKALPLVDTPEKILPEGNSVVSSIETGVVLGIMFETEGYIRQKPENIVIFTGGDAIYFAKRMKNSIFVVCNLELMGLALITDDYVKKNIE